MCGARRRGTLQLVSFDAGLVEASRMALDQGLYGRLATVQVDPRDPRTGPLRRLHGLILAGVTDAFAREVAVVEAVGAFTSFLDAAPRRTEGWRPSVRRARAFLLEHLAERVTLDDLRITRARTSFTCAARSRASWACRRTRS